MAKERFLFLDYAVIAEKYPMAVEKLATWFGTREDIVAAVKSNDMKTEDIPALAKHMASMIVQYDPRKLYDFFDDQKIIIYITTHPDYNESFVHFNSKINQSKPAETRVEAEKAAFMNAFDTLEKELTTY